MATDKLVEIDHVTDYISREAAIQAIEDIDENAGARGSGFTDPERIMRDSAFFALEAIQPAYVRPVVLCKDCIHAPLPGDCEGNDIEWPKIDGIYEDYTCPHCCGDNWYSTRPDPDGFCEKGERREPNLDTTKGDNHD